MNKEYFRQYYKNNKARLDAYHKKYVKQHAKQIQEYLKKYQQKRKAKLLEERKQRLLKELNQAKIKNNFENIYNKEIIKILKVDFEILKLHVLTLLELKYINQRNPLYNP